MQHSLFTTEVSCRRCGVALTFDPTIDDEPFWCAACDAYLDKTTRHFVRPYRPETLWTHGGYYRIDDLDDPTLIKVYQYAQLISALYRYPDYRFYRWSTNWTCALSQAGGVDRISDLKRALDERKLGVDGDNFCIDFQSMRRWVASQSQ